MRKDDRIRLRHMLDAAREAVEFAQDGRFRYQPGHLLEDGARRPSTACADSFRGFGRGISAPGGIRQYNTLENRLVPAGLAKQSLGLQTQ